jgi:hypothetical protein
MNVRNRLERLEAAAEQMPKAPDRILTLGERAFRLVDLARRVANENGITPAATVARFREAARVKHGGESEEQAAMWMAVDALLREREADAQPSESDATA